MSRPIMKEAAVPLAVLIVLIPLLVVVFAGKPSTPSPSLSPQQMEAALREADVARLNAMMETRRSLIDAGVMSQERAEAEMRLELIKIREEWRSRSQSK